jgi:ArsR family transcriptional regulator, arsenate/arsenite/antimonite-responsive transcriptional repressor
MELETAAAALAALAHPSRLAVFRLLVREGPGGCPAGEIAREIGMSATAASFHLKELDRAGLVHAVRKGRYIHYAAHIEGIRSLLAFLTEDCCEGRPELCGAGFSQKSLCCPDGGMK